MSESIPASSSETAASRIARPAKQGRWPFTIVWFLGPILAAVLLFQFDSFDPAELPANELGVSPVVAPRVNRHILRGSERVGDGKLSGPEDIAYDPKSGLIYTGCADGWVKRVSVNESASDSSVENWVNTGGRPLGLVVGFHNEVIVADPEKGLLKVTEDGKVELLTDEAEGVKFKLTEGVDIARDGMIYFTDASYKYRLKDFIWDALEGRPHGRLLRFHPVTKQTDVLVRDLYFANGVAVSPDQEFVVFCETLMSRCKKHYISGERKGSVDKFIDGLPGLPDNVRYDGEGHFWIAIASGTTFPWNMARKYPFIRKCLAMMEKYLKRPDLNKNGGAFLVDLEGKPVAHYFDPGLSFVSGGIKIGNYLYIGSLIDSCIIRLDLNLHGAQELSSR